MASANPDAAPAPIRCTSQVTTEIGARAACASTARTSSTSVAACRWRPMTRRGERPVPCGGAAVRGDDEHHAAQLRPGRGNRRTCARRVGHHRAVPSSAAERGGERIAGSGRDDEPRPGHGAHGDRRRLGRLPDDVVDPLLDALVGAVEAAQARGR